MLQRNNRGFLPSYFFPIFTWRKTTQLKEKKNVQNKIEQDLMGKTINEILN